MLNGNPDVITRDSMIAPVLEASPQFRAIWDEFIAEWKDDDRGLPLYLLLSELARHISKLLREESDLELRRLFEVIEAWHLNGDDYVKEAATVGLLEGLQNENVVGAGIPTELERYLLPESKRWWEKMK